MFVGSSLIFNISCFWLISDHTGGAISGTSGWHSSQHYEPKSRSQGPSPASSSSFRAGNGRLP